MTSEALSTRIHRGIAWSTVNNLVLRLGNFAMGILLARLLAPGQFGVFAIALTVQAVLMTVADLGLSADLIRSEQPERIAPTVATLALCTGGGLCLAMALSSSGTAALLGSPESGPVIAVLSLTMLLSGAGVVPYAKLQRNYEQRKLFGIAVVEFVVGTAATVGLILAGFGVMALAISRLLSQGTTLTLQFILSGERPKYGLDRKLAPSVLAYGLPVAGANMLSWALLNVDNVVVSKVAGPVALGYYFLAFNISNWPMSTIGQIVRSMALPTFSRVSTGRLDRTLAIVIAPIWALSLLVGLMLAVLSAPVIALVYGDKWLPSVPVLAVLGLFGALRVLTDLSASYLLARGRSVATFTVQVVWIVALVPAMAAGVGLGETVGAGLAHLAVAALIVCPAYFLALTRAGADGRSLLRALWPATAAAVPAATAALVVQAAVNGPLVQLFAGGAVGSAVYALLLGKWFFIRLDAAKRVGDRGATTESLAGPELKAAESAVDIITGREK